VTQNIYDNPTFFAGYSQLRRSLEGLDGAPEWPALRALLPDLRGLRVLDLGCGFGWFCRWASARGATTVVGVDVSDNMLERARAAWVDFAISYVKADLERLDVQAGSFDLVYSSLALHYLEDLEGLFGAVHAALVPGGRLVFSVEHPIFTAPTDPGWLAGSDRQRKIWPVDNYLIEGPRSTNWLAPGVIKQHRSIATYVNLLLRRDFSILHLEEWGPTGEQIAAEPALADELQRPPFLFIAAQR
jgi:SAM-dependent methyltransferase